MAAKKMYAWSEIKYTTHVNDKTVTHRLKCGSEAIQVKMGLTDPQWEELVTTKAIRAMPYPVPPSTNPISPVTHFRRLAKMIETGADDPALLQSVLPPLPEVGPATEPAT